MPAPVKGTPPTEITVLIPSEAIIPLNARAPADRLGGASPVVFVFEEEPHPLEAATPSADYSPWG